MITIGKQVIFQQEWTGEGERGIRDFLLIPAIFFGAVSPGLYISSMLFDYIPGFWVALAMNFAGYGITHLLFLGKAERFWRAMFNWKTSWISRGFIFNAFFTGFGFLYALGISADIPVLSNAPIKNSLKYLSAVSAVFFAAYPGFMLSIVKAIPFWRSILEPVLFFIQAVMGGIALNIICAHFIPMETTIINNMIQLNLLLTLVVLLLVMAALIIKALHGGAEKISVEFLLNSGFSSLFIYGAVIAGLIMPVFILLAGIIMPLEYEKYRYIYQLIMLMELCGIYITKYSILKAGAYSPLA